MAEKETLGKVKVNGDQATLLFIRDIKHSPDEVWKLLTDPDELAIWYMSKADIDGRIGGVIDLVSGPARFHVSGKVRQWYPPRIFEHEWKVEPRPELPGGENAIISWSLDPYEGGTRLKLEHIGLTLRTAYGFAPGTHAYLDRLEAQLDHKKLPGWQERYDEVVVEYKP